MSKTFIEISMQKIIAFVSFFFSYVFSFETVVTQATHVVYELLFVLPFPPKCWDYSMCQHGRRSELFNGNDLYFKTIRSLGVVKEQGL